MRLMLCGGSFQLPLMSGELAAGGARPADEELVMISRCPRLASNIALFSAHLGVQITFNSHEKEFRLTDDRGKKKN